MKPRSLGRRLAMQYLFMRDVAGVHADALIDFDGFLATQRAAEEEVGADFGGRAGEKWTEAAEFARELVDRVAAHRDALDARIAAACVNWDFARIAATDKNVLRVAVAELTESAPKAFAVVVNEAVRLAKTFGGEDSGAFVNGVLSAFGPEND